MKRVAHWPLFEPDVWLKDQFDLTLTLSRLIPQNHLLFSYRVEVNSLRVDEYIPMVSTY